MPDAAVSARTAPETAGDAMAGWTSTYLRVRELEGRLLPDELVATLPEMPATHALAGEWRQRADSARRLTAYLETRPYPVRVIEVGCGNGWLAHRLAQVPRATIVGVDANGLELEQARRVFGSVPNLSFVLGDLATLTCPLAAPNVIVLASVVQYVSDLPALVSRLLGWLTPAGEIHILDSPFYRPAEIEQARARTRRYYAALGVAGMAEHYWHHSLRELKEFEPVLLYRPNDPRRRIERRVLRIPRSPFPWLRIRPRTSDARRAESDI